MASSPEREIFAEPIETRFADIYFAAIVFTIWDNIYGPRVMKVWLKDGSKEQSMGDKDSALSYQTLSAVAIYTLTGEASRHGSIVEVEPKFYCLPDKDIIVMAFLFTVAYEKKSDLFSLLFVLPYNELSDWLGRHLLLCGKMKDVLKFNLIPRLRSMYKLPNFTSFALLPKQFNSALSHFLYQEDENGSSVDSALQRLHLISVQPKDLRGFVELAYTIRHFSLPDPSSIPLKETFFGQKMEDQDIEFLQRVITSHLQTSCYSVVLGDEEDAINTMIKTLGFFLSASERQMSRMITKETNDLEYLRDLFIQGFLYTSGSDKLPLKVVHLKASLFAPTLIDMNTRTVRQVSEPAVHQFQKQQLGIYIQNHSSAPYEQQLRSEQAITDYMKQRSPKLNDFSIKHDSSVMVKEFLTNLYSLPAHNGSREGYVSQFTRLLNRKTFALVHYVEAEQEHQNWLAYEAQNDFNASKILDLPKLMNDLSLCNDQDLRMILGLASKVDRGIIAKVLGDRNIPAAEFIKELRTV